MLRVITEQNIRIEIDNEGAFLLIWSKNARKQMQSGRVVPQEIMHTRIEVSRNANKKLI